MVELMITLAVAVILIAIAVPSFTYLIANNRLTTVANEMVDAVHTARMEAIKHNANAQFCSNSSTNNTTDTLGTACGTAGGAVAAMTATTAAQTRAAPSGLAAPIYLSGDLTALRFNAQGIASAVGSSTSYSGKVAEICTTSMSTNNHLTINMTAGSVLVVAPPSTGTCP